MMWRKILKFSTKHTADTSHPQTYWEHAMIAIPYSCTLIVYGLAGIVHGGLPEIKKYQFYTSTGVMKWMCGLMLSSTRHDDEIREVYGEEFLELIRKMRAKKAS